MKNILIKGAREHNLKNIDVLIPRDKLVVITGVSGSGKSSLAFDTIYAEGQRRYVESLSAYARQFLEQVDKPDVESIEGLSPSISIEQKTTSRNPRSTVATVTELYDYLRLLFARVGRPFCYKCGKAITAQSIEQMVERVMALPEGQKVIIYSPLVQGRKGGYRKELNNLLKEGYTRVVVDGETRDLEETIILDKRKKHSIDVVIDRLVIKEGLMARLGDSLEAATRLSGGLARVEVLGGEEFFFNENLACVKCGISYPEVTPAFFSFNSPYGACAECKGLGEDFYFDPARIIPDPGQTLSNGAIAPWKAGNGKGCVPYYYHILKGLSAHYGFSLSEPWQALPESVREVILSGTGDEEVEFYYDMKSGNRSYRGPFEGVINNLERRYRETTSESVKKALELHMSSESCKACNGSRLKSEALFIRVGGKSIFDVVRMSIEEAGGFFSGLKLSGLETEIARRILKEIVERLGFLLNVGLGYITLERAASTLSGGEAQRIRLATQIGSSLVGVLYILDEPSIGLHQRDNRRLLGALKRLRDMGNSVIVVEHDEETMRESDYIIDMGPGAGGGGGQVVAIGPYDEILAQKASLTGRYLCGELCIPLPERRKKPGKRVLSFKGCSANNLKDIDVDIPLGLITCVTGVSGSGKSTLVLDTIYRNLAKRLYRTRARAGGVGSITGLEFIDKVIAIDQTPIGRTPRSNPATYTGLFTFVRELFSNLPQARVRGYGPGRFSFNVKGGRCEACRGDGLIKVEMHFLPDVYVTCDVCRGARYNRETLDVRFKGKTIADCLNLTVTEALEFFANIPRIKERLKTLHDVGLGYITLGQPTTHLSGGEAQRIKISRELSKRGTGRTLYILDEPTTGLHFADTQMLIDVLARLTTGGNSVLIIEHNLDVIKSADYVIDLGPEGGSGGGAIVASGTPEAVAAAEGSHTGFYLRPVLAGQASPS
ncbi:MAG: excinuclease ABC subunit UvrA [Thermodesulfobacteriota bacterium]